MVSVLRPMAGSRAQEASHRWGWRGVEMAHQVQARRQRPGTSAPQHGPQALLHHVGGEGQWAQQRGANWEAQGSARLQRRNSLLVLHLEQLVANILDRAKRTPHAMSPMSNHHVVG